MPNHDTVSGCRRQASNLPLAQGGSGRCAQPAPTLFVFFPCHCGLDPQSMDAGPCPPKLRACSPSTCAASAQRHEIQRPHVQTRHAGPDGPTDGGGDRVRGAAQRATGFGARDRGAGHARLHHTRPVRHRHGRGTPKLPGRADRRWARVARAGGRGRYGRGRPVAGRDGPGGPGPPPGRARRFRGAGGQRNRGCRRAKGRHGGASGAGRHHNPSLRGPGPAELRQRQRGRGETAGADLGRCRCARRPGQPRGCATRPGAPEGRTRRAGATTPERPPRRRQ